MIWPRDAYAGQKVACIDVRRAPRGRLKKGAVYTIAGVVANQCGVFIHLQGIDGGWYPDRFRPLEEPRRKKSTHAAVEKLKRDLLGTPAKVMEPANV